MTDTNTMSSAIASAFALGRLPGVQRRAAEYVAWEAAMNGLAVAFDLPLDVAKERFEKRRLRSVLSWRRVASQCLSEGEL